MWESHSQRRWKFYCSSLTLFFLAMAVPNEGFSTGDTLDRGPLPVPKYEEVPYSSPPHLDFSEVFCIDDPRQAAENLLDQAQNLQIDLEHQEPVRAIADKVDGADYVRLPSGKEITTTPERMQRLLARAESVRDGDKSTEKILGVIRFGEVPSVRDLSEIMKLGSRLIAPLGKRSYIVMLPLGQVTALLTLPQIVWASEYLPEEKLAPDIVGGSNVFDIRTTECLLEGLVSELQSHDVIILHVSDILDYVVIRTPHANLPEISGIPFVTSITQEISPEPMSSPNVSVNFNPIDSRRLVSSGIASYHGDGVTVGVRDKGIDMNHQELRNILHPDSDGDNNHRHGTHVTGILAAEPTSIEGFWETTDVRGVAYEAEVLFRQYDNPLSLDFESFTDNGVRISNHSYGWILNYQYDAITEAFDTYCDDEDMIIVVAAGNCDPFIMNPATGKNVISVGAIDFVTWGTRTIGQRANYSNQGPTMHDARLKPDIVAPGGHANCSSQTYPYGVVSAYAQGATKYTPWDTDPDYARVSGTSMAAPHVAGIGAVRLSLAEEMGWAESSEIFKANLINNAIPIWENDGDPNGGWATPGVGYGLANEFTLVGYYPDEMTLWGFAAWINEDFSVPRRYNATLNVPSGTKLLTVTMAYNDEQGEESNADALKDDLDLVLIAPSGTVFRADDYLHPDVTTESPLEKLSLADPQVGAWTVRVEFNDSPGFGDPTIFAEQKFGVAATCHLKTPELAMEIVSCPESVVAGESFLAQVRVENVGGGIAAGVTAMVNGGGYFGSEDVRSQYLRNLFYDGDDAYANFELVAPEEPDNYTVTFEVDGINREFDSGYPRTNTRSIQVICPVPNAASSCSASDDLCDRITVTWSDNSSNETGFKVYRNGTRITTTSANETSYNDTLVPGAHSYRVVATNACGDATASGADSGMRLPVPVAASGCTATDDLTDRITVSWIDNSSDETGFKVLRDGAVIETTEADITGYDDVGVPPGTYTYTVVATGSCGDGDASNADGGTRVEGGPIEWPLDQGGNGHFYVIVGGEGSPYEDGVTWAEADAQAKLMSHQGRNGHLATITSLDEFLFISNLPNLYCNILDGGGCDKLHLGGWSIVTEIINPPPIHAPYVLTTPEQWITSETGSYEVTPDALVTGPVDGVLYFAWGVYTLTGMGLPDYAPHASKFESGRGFIVEFDDYIPDHYPDIDPDPVCSISHGGLGFSDEYGQHQTQCFTITNIGGGLLEGDYGPMEGDFYQMSSGSYSLANGEAAEVCVSVSYDGCDGGQGEGTIYTTCGPVGISSTGEDHAVAQLSTNSLTFSVGAVGVSQVHVFQVSEVGCDPGGVYTADLASQVSGDFSISPPALELHNGNVQDVTITYTPSGYGNDELTLALPGWVHGNPELLITGVGPQPSLAFPAAGRFEGEPDFLSNPIDGFNGGYDVAAPGEPADLQQAYVYGGMPGAVKIVPFFGTLTRVLGGQYQDTDWLLFNESWTQWEEVVIESSRVVLVERYTIVNNVPNRIGFNAVVPGVPTAVSLVSGSEMVCLRLSIASNSEADIEEAQYLIYTQDAPPNDFLELSGSVGNCIESPFVPMWYLNQVTAPPTGHGEFWFSNDTRAFQNNYNPGATSLVGADMSGPDTVIELFLYSNPLSVHLEAEGWGGRCYLLGDCGEAQASCLAVSDPQGNLNYTPNVSGYYYLVVDGPSNTGGEFAVWGNFTHPLGFILEETLPTNDTCIGASVLPHGDIDEVGFIGTAHNDYDPGEGGCTDWGETGGDVVWRVDMTSGDVLDVTMTTSGQWDDSIYLVANCADPVGSCVIGDDAYPDGSNFVYTAEFDATYFLIVDSYGLGIGEYFLSGSLGNPVNSVLEMPGLPTAYYLGEAYPNPFNPKTTINFDIAESGRVRLTIYDISGRTVKDLIDGDFFDRGSHESVWFGRDGSGRTVSAGVYFYRLEAGSFTETKRMALVK